MKIYFFDDGMARFATRQYESVKEGADIKDLFIHLTNYSINKRNSEYMNATEADGSTGGS